MTANYKRTIYYKGGLAMSKALKHKIMLGLSIISNSYKNLWDIDNCHFTEQGNMAQKKVKYLA